MSGVAGVTNPELFGKRGAAAPIQLWEPIDVDRKDQVNCIGAHDIRQPWIACHSDEHRVAETIGARQPIDAIVRSPPGHVGHHLELGINC